MHRIWHMRRWLLVVLGPALVFGAGCGGIRTGGSVSPATFLLPGLGSYSAPPASNSPPVSVQVAQATSSVSMN